MRRKVDMDEDEKGKLFVGGLSWETTQEALQRYFQRYGEVVDCVVMKNTESGRSRGFGFVTFADPANAAIVLNNGPHVLDGRTIDPKPCNPRTLSKPKRNNGYPKVFLGGLPSNVTETDLRAFFGNFGKVMEVVIMYDQEKKKSRGFGFLSFEDEDSVERCVAEHFVNLNGKQVEIKKAEPRDSSNKMNDGGNTWGAPPGGPQMGMGGGMGMSGHNGQMSGPMGGMGHMPPGNMMQSYQGWGTPPASTAYPGQWGPSPPNQPPVNGYGTPSGTYQQWGAPPGPQSQQLPPPQWASNYASQTSSYGSYPAPAAPQSGYSSNWNWNLPQGGGGGGPQQGGPPGPPNAGPQAGDVYGRGSGAGSGGGGSGGSGKDYAYNSYGAYSQDSSSYGGVGRSYGGGGGIGTDQSSSAGGGAAAGYGGHPPVPECRRFERHLMISFKEYLEAEQNSVPVYTTNLAKSYKLSLYESSPESSDESPKISARSDDYHNAPGPNRRSLPSSLSKYHPYNRN